MANGYVGGEAEPVWPDITASLLFHLAINSRHIETPPFLTLAVGRDSHSWGISIQVAERADSRTVQRVQKAVSARWRKDLLDLPGVALVAQGALRRLAQERDWPII